MQPKVPITSLGLLCLMLLTTACSLNAGQTRTGVAGTEEWRLEFTRSGGIAGIEQSIHIDNLGNTSVIDQRKGRRGRGQVDAEQLDIIDKEVKKMLGAAEDNTLQMRRPCADCINYTLHIQAKNKRRKAGVVSTAIKNTPYRGLIEVLGQELDKSLKKLQ